jgi:hypothetical protein
VAEPVPMQSTYLPFIRHLPTTVDL